MYSHCRRAGCDDDVDASAAAAAASAGVGADVPSPSPSPSPSPVAPRMMICTFRRIISVKNSWWHLGSTGNPRLLDTNARGETTTARTGSPTHRSSSAAGGSVAPISRHAPSCEWPSHNARRFAQRSNGSWTRRRVGPSTAARMASADADDVAAFRVEASTSRDRARLSASRASADSTSGATTGTRTQSAVWESAPRNWLTRRA